MSKTYEQLIEFKNTKRISNENKADLRISSLEEKADRLIGELASGKCYFFPIGGKYREGTRVELIQFIIRNKYVR